MGEAGEEDEVGDEVDEGADGEVGADGGGLLDQGEGVVEYLEGVPDDC